MPKPTTKQLEAMRKLGLSDEEIKELIAADAAIDKGEKMPFDLTEEQAKEAKKYIKTGTKKAPTVYNLDNADGKRSRKENPTKAAIIQYLFECLKDYDNVVITNKERQISFSCGDNNFELTLVQKRKK